MYPVSMGNSTRLGITLSSMVTEAEGSSSLRAMNVTGVVYRLLRNFTSAAYTMSCSEFVEACVGMGGGLGG